jgi:hypothetical protein
MSDFGTTIAAIVSAVLVLAIVAVVVSNNAQTGNAISTAGSGLASLISTALGSSTNLSTATTAAAAPFVGSIAVGQAASSYSTPFLGNFGVTF